jgi:hypothetical protein
MSSLAKLYASIFLWVPLAPPVVAAVALFALRFVRGRRWVVHIFALVAMLLTMPIYFFVWSVVDPIALELPGPGDGFVILLWIFFLICSMIFYAAHAAIAYWMSRRHLTSAA